jgi:hypothetical protein
MLNQIFFIITVALIRKSKAYEADVKHYLKANDEISLQEQPFNMQNERKLTDMYSWVHG